MRRTFLPDSYSTSSLSLASEGIVFGTVCARRLVINLDRLSQETQQNDFRHQDQPDDRKSLLTGKRNEEVDDQRRSSARVLLREIAGARLKNRVAARNRPANVAARREAVSRFPPSIALTGIAALAGNRIAH